MESTKGSYPSYHDTISIAVKVYGHTKIYFVLLMLVLVILRYFAFRCEIICDDTFIYVS